MPRQLRRLIQKLQCRRGQHLPIVCEVAIFNDMTQQHTHDCQSCHTRIKDETLPIDPNIEQLLTQLGIPLSLDPGLPIERQREAFLN